MPFFRAKSLAPRVLPAIHALLLTAFAFCAPLQALGADPNQAEAQRLAERLNNRGSSDSIDAATTNGITALNNLASLNIPGAITFGYKAYGEYLNSNELDDLERKTAKNKNIMSSVAAGAVSNADTKAQAVNQSASGLSGTPLSRMDPSALYKGELGAAAELFEKKSGMKREQLLAELQEVEANGLSFSDPQLVPKLYSRYKSFMAKIPNKDFKENLEKLEGLVPRPMQEQILGRLQERYNEKNPQAGSKIAESIFAAPAEGTPPIVAAARTEEKSVADRAPASAADSVNAPSNTSGAEQAVNPAVAKDKPGFFIGLGQVADVSLDGFLKSSSMESESMSIFARVSTRYRALTPNLLVRAKAAN